MSEVMKMQDSEYDEKSRISEKIDEILGSSHDNSNSTREILEKNPLDATPPSFELAKIHQNASRVKLMSQRTKEISQELLADEKFYCPCCQMPTSEVVPEIPLCSKYKDLKDLGTGFPLYYQLKLFTIMVYTVMAVFGLLFTIWYALDDKGHEWNDKGDTPFMVTLSIGNFGRDEKNYTPSRISGLLVYSALMIILIITGSIFLRFFQKQIDEANTTPSEFCLMVNGIPLSKTQQDAIEFFKKFDENLEIVYVNYCYDIRDIVKESRGLTRLKLEKAYILSERKKILKETEMTEEQAKEMEIDANPLPIKRCCLEKKFDSLESIEEKIRLSEERIGLLQLEIDVENEENLFCGTCFLVLNKQNQVDQLALKFEVSPIRRVINLFIYKVLGCKKSNADDRYWEGKRIFVEKAAEPGDIYWENLSVKTISRVKKTLITYTIAFLCL